MVCNITEAESAKIFSNLGELVNGVFEVAKDSINLEVTLSQKNLEDQASGGFWDRMLATDILSVEEQLASNTALNPADLASGELKFNNILIIKYVVSSYHLTFINVFAPNTGGL